MLLLFLFSFLTGFFGYGFASSSIFTWLDLMVMYAQAKGVGLGRRSLWSRDLSNLFLIIAPRAVAHAGAFATQANVLPEFAGGRSFVLMLMLSSALWTFLGFSSLYAAGNFNYKLSGHAFGPFAFPTFWCASWLLVALTPLGTYFLPTSTQVDWLPFVQCASLIGAIGMTFITAWAAVVVVDTLLLSRTTRAPITRLNSSAGSIRSIPINTRPPVPAAPLPFLIFMTLALAFGGLRISIGRGNFPLRDIEAAAPNSYIQASCLLAQDRAYGTRSFESLLKTTEDRLKAGADLVLWSEEGALVTTPRDEAALLNWASTALAHSDKQYIGITYELRNASHGRTDNVFALYGPKGQQLWRYSKAHPVPFVEGDVTPGKEQAPPLVKTHLGNVAGVICFDLDHPGFVRRAGYGSKQGWVDDSTRDARVDLILQPSWTWSAMGPLHFQGNSLRAVEIGATIFRCSSDGYSAVVSPYYEIFDRRVTLDDGAFNVLIPKHKGVDTFYLWGGWLFPWVCLAFSLLSWDFLLWQGPLLFVLRRLVQVPILGGCLSVYYRCPKDGSPIIPGLRSAPSVRRRVGLRAPLLQAIEEGSHENGGDPFTAEQEGAGHVQVTAALLKPAGDDSDEEATESRVPHV